MGKLVAAKSKTIVVVRAVVRLNHHIRVSQEGWEVVQVTFKFRMPDFVPLPVLLSENRGVAKGSANLMKDFVQKMQPIYRKHSTVYK